jgi:drug/metabolite transporter (DMT)-like permease
MSLAAAFLWGSGDFCGGVAVRRASPYLIVTLAHGLSLVLLIGVAVVLNIPLPLDRSIEIAVAAGVLGGIGLVLLYAALAVGTMGLSASVGGLITALIPLLFSIWTEYRRTGGWPHPVQLMGFATAAVAIWLIAWAPGPIHPRGLGLAAGAGVCFGMLLVMLKLAAGAEASTHQTLWILAFARAGSTATAGVMTVISSQSKTATSSRHVFRNVGLIALIALAGVLDTSGNLLYTMATQIGNLGVAAVISSLYPGATIVLAMLLLKERTTRIQALGMALALVAVILISR